MNILVTGATGFIGLALTKRLLAEHHNITVLLRESSNTEELEKLNCTIVKYTLLEDIIDFFKANNFEGVVHIASNVIVEHKNSDIAQLVSSNVTFGTYLLEACKLTNVKWFINTGTFWQNYQNEAYNPVNLYAATKEAFEVVARYYTETSSLIFTTIKLNDTFGPKDTRPKIFTLWNEISSTGKTLDMSLGEQIIDISYIEDVINGYMALLGHLGSAEAIKFKNKTFVISNKEKMPLKRLATLFENVTCRQLKINWGAREYRSREVMQPYALGESIPNWQQKYSLENAIKKTLEEIDNE